MRQKRLVFHPKPVVLARGPEVEHELIQTHTAQKPMQRVEVGALGAHQIKNMRGRAG